MKNLDEHLFFDPFVVSPDDSLFELHRLHQWIASIGGTAYGLPWWPSAPVFATS